MVKKQMDAEYIAYLNDQITRGEAKLKSVKAWREEGVFFCQDGYESCGEMWGITADDLVIHTCDDYYIWVKTSCSKVTEIIKDDIHPEEVDYDKIKGEEILFLDDQGNLGVPVIVSGLSAEEILSLAGKMYEEAEAPDAVVRKGDAICVDGEALSYAGNSGHQEYVDYLIKHNPDHEGFYDTYAVYAQAIQIFPIPEPGLERYVDIDRMT